ncbi:hypothetical protein L1887_05497 [Cichorium endivia]|nr:hypothetical protein L1887_05497 [Cichorium endivia]
MAPASSVAKFGICPTVSFLRRFENRVRSSWNPTPKSSANTKETSNTLITPNLHLHSQVSKTELRLLLPPVSP